MDDSPFLAGLFTENQTTRFLNEVKHVAQNFLDLLGNDNRAGCLQEVFKTIMTRHKPGPRSKITLTLMIPGECELVFPTRAAILLIEAFKVSSDQIRPQPIIRDIHVADAENQATVKVVFQLISLMNVLDIESVKFGEVENLEIKTIKLTKDTSSQL